MRRSVNPPTASAATNAQDLAKSVAAEPTTRDATRARSAIVESDDASERTWQPGDRQRAAKAKLLIAMRHDPLLDPSQLTVEQLATYMGVSHVTANDWGKHPEFRKWLVAKHEVEEKAQYLLDNWLRKLEDRLPGMGDKEFIAAGKLLNEIVARQAEQAAPPSADLGAKTPEQLVALLKQVAPALLVAAGVPTTTQPQAQES